MKTTLDEFILNNDNGLLLLDSPTGFGKTYSVLNIIQEFLKQKSFENVKRMFFVTNLKTNLPYGELFEKLTDEEKRECFVLKSYEDSLFDNWNRVTSFPEEIKNTKEFKLLKNDIEILNELHEEKNNLLNDKKSITKKMKSINSFHNKIATVTEPAFRELVRKTYFFGKSIFEKKKIIDENVWLKIIYPICEVEKYKVIFMTTAKFFSPINTFYRMPFYIYDDNIVKDSVVFIDEFDATKKFVLNQIIEDSLKISVNLIDLFKSIYFSLKNHDFPKSLTRVTKYNQKKVEEGEWKAAEEIIAVNTEIFENCYKNNNFQLLLKSKDFEYKKAFLFDDGNYVTVFNDSNKKHLVVREDSEEKLLNISAEQYSMDKLTINKLIGEIQGCLKHFANAIFYLSNNYFYYKNGQKNGNENQFSVEESISTILTTFNISDENKLYIRKLMSLNEHQSLIENDSEIRKGFKFTEVEDSNYHDLQSVVHQFNFETTPENLIILLSQKAKVIGVSATATLPTVIGNYDINYIKNILGENYKEITPINFNRIMNDFKNSQCLYNDEIEINVEIIDDLNCFSEKDKAKELLNIIFNGETLSKYLEMAESETTDGYYFLIYIKLAYVYYLVGKNKIKSFISFLNRIPKPFDSKLNSEKLTSIFQDVAKNNGFKYFDCYFVQSDNYDEVMSIVYDELKEDKSCFVITSYQTIGSGKNIQYDITPEDECRVVINDKERMQKDFEGIYLETPRNLTQTLTKDSEDKYRDLSNYLFQQQSLYLNDRITYGQYRQNILSGFKRVFFSNWYVPYYNKNSDMYCHSAQIAIQAVGRICRCKNKNRNIFIFSEKQLVERLKSIDEIISARLFNKEFEKLYSSSKKIKTFIPKIEDYSKQSKQAFGSITKNAYTVRSSPKKVEEWINLRDYVLKNPTSFNVVDKYNDLYFCFDSKQRGYSYKYGAGFNIVDIKFDTREDMTQVSDNDCDLPIMLNVSCVNELFKTNNYIGQWKAGTSIMSPSLYNQVYKGALGEVVGKCILESELGWDLEEIEDYSKYELFDFKIKNTYFDFKHWNDFYKDSESYVKKIKNKLNKVNGEKAIIINIIKRGEYPTNINVDEDIIQIPYIIDDNTNEVSMTMIESIEAFMNK